MYHNATPVRSRFKLWNESGTNRARIGDSCALRLRSPQYLALTFTGGTRSSLARLDKRRHRGKMYERMRQTVAPGVNRIPRFPFAAKASILLVIRDLRHACSAPSLRLGHCVLATRGGVAWVMNWVASSMAVPSGVGTTIRNGTRMRVPASGAKAISMLRWAARYLITGRSGM